MKALLGSRLKIAVTILLLVMASSVLAFTGGFFSASADSHGSSQLVTVILVALVLISTLLMVFYFKKPGTRTAPAYDDSHFLQDMIDAIEHKYLILSPDYDILRMNRVAREELPVTINPGAFPLKCYQAFAKLDQPCSSTKDRPCPVAKVLETGQTTRIIHQYNEENSIQRTFEIVASPLQDDQGGLIAIIETSRDITDQITLARQLVAKDKSYAHLANHDQLTELPNRLLFADRLNQAIHSAHRHSKMLAVLTIGLDNFKKINASFGHQYGDALLKAFASRLTVLIREDDTLARMGGDEFAVILNDIKHAEDVAVVANNILQLFETSFSVFDTAMFLSSSIGISIYPQHGDTAEVLLRNSFSALHRAKEDGQKTFEYYSRGLTADAFQHILLETNLRHALNRNELVLHYQPQLDLHHNELIGIEALLRWHHPEMGLVAPDKFIPLAEENGMIIDIGKWVLHQACLTMKEWLDKLLVPDNALMCVNLSAKQFDQWDIVESVQQILLHTCLPPANLELEITESTVMKSPEFAEQTLMELRKLGVKIAIDDFGTGYSSLSHLKTLPLTKLKIDKTFIDGTPDSLSDVAIAQAIIALGNSLSLEVLAEGIENDKQQKFLEMEGCDSGQGYLFSRPLSEKEFENYLKLTSLQQQTA